MSSPICITIAVSAVILFFLLIFVGIQAHLIWQSLGALGKRISASVGFAKGNAPGKLDGDFLMAPDAAAQAASSLALRILDAADDLHRATELSPPPGKGHSVITPQPKDNGPWQVIGTAQLPYFCAIGRWDNYVCVVFRGTSDHNELLHNDFGVQFIAKDGTKAIKRLVKSGVPLPYPPQTTLKGLGLPGDTDPKVNTAFYTSYVGSIATDVRAAVERLYTGINANIGPLVIGGHSLGAGVACICALLLSREGVLPKGAEMRLVAAAVPKPGDGAFRRCLLRSQTSCICYANEMDLIPWSPVGIIPDFTAASGVLEYVLAPGTWTFSYGAKALVECHSIEAYRAGVRSAQRKKASCET